jgi:hypothetical protein
LWLALAAERQDVGRTTNDVTPAELIQRDHWTAVSGETDSGGYMLRFREPLLQPPDVHEYPRCLRVLWAYDGARQWVFYTANLQECRARLNAMPQEQQRYPIELDAFDDAEWDYLRNEIIRDRGSN